jgi:hypothetical protein
MLGEAEGDRCSSSAGKLEMVASVARGKRRNMDQMLVGLCANCT